jgi:hypothetical protein
MQCTVSHDERRLGGIDNDDGSISPAALRLHHQVGADVPGSDDGHLDFHLTESITE